MEPLDSSSQFMVLWLLAMPQLLVTSVATWVLLSPLDGRRVRPAMRDRRDQWPLNVPTSWTVPAVVLGFLIANDGMLVIGMGSMSLMVLPAATLANLGVLLRRIGGRARMQVPPGFGHSSSVGGGLATLAAVAVLAAIAWWMVIIGTVGGGLVALSVTLAFSAAQVGIGIRRARRGLSCTSEVLAVLALGCLSAAQAQQLSSPAFSLRLAAWLTTATGHSNETFGRFASQSDVGIFCAYVLCRAASLAVAMQLVWQAYTDSQIATNVMHGRIRSVTVGLRSAIDSGRTTGDAFAGARLIEAVIREFVR